MRTSRVKGRCPHCLKEIGVPLALSLGESLECVKCRKKLKDIPSTRRNFEARKSQCVRCWNHGDGKKKKRFERSCRLCGHTWEFYPSWTKRRLAPKIHTATLCVQCRSKFKRPNCIIVRDPAPLYMLRITNGRRYVSIYEDARRERSEWIPLARLMVECFIGRKLNGRSESVHHKNHDKMDDRIENLSVKSASEHIKEHIVEQKKSPTWSNWVPREVTCVACGQIGLRIGPRVKYCSRACGSRYRGKKKYWRRKEKNANGKAEVPGVQDEVQAAGGLGGVLLKPLRPAGETTEMA